MNEKDWELLQSPDGTYSIYLSDSEHIGEKSVLFTVSKSEAERIVETTGCKVEQLPF